jgi:hypothetical protein
MVLLYFLRIRICEYRVLRRQVYALGSPVRIERLPLDERSTQLYVTLDCGSAEIKCRLRPGKQ